MSKKEWVQLKRILENDLRFIQGKLREHKDEIYKYSHITDDRWRRFAKTIVNPMTEGICFFLITCGYALGGEQGIEKLTEILTGESQIRPNHPKIWFEAEPISPRIDEGETSLDLALGTITRRKEKGKEKYTKGGIELDISSGKEKTWICFCEAKLYSDIDVKVTHDIYRNQLARVIENALCFQAFGEFSKKVYSTLIVPRSLSDVTQESRLYHYRFQDYQCSENLMNDLKRCRLDEMHEDVWDYPTHKVLSQQISRHCLRLVTFERLLDNLPCPDGDLPSRLRHFWERVKKYCGDAQSGRLLRMRSRSLGVSGNSIVEDDV